jgi:hypothetical protein
VDRRRSGGEAMTLGRFAQIVCATIAIGGLFVLCFLAFINGF